IEGANIVSSSPESVISYLPSSDITTETAITFTGAASTDNTGIVSYAWDFGDGTFSTEANPSHTFVSGGSFRVSLTVTDGDGLSDTESVLIDVFEPLPDSSADFSLYLNAGNGKTVNYEGKEYIGDRTTSLEYF
ncbi:PKD domain-containing protein, partial [Algoriphagus sp. SE2]|uniref:PKD domain-containing protein n=1 Tax=Algoriphagus sp. SE2 TaxID=3141536 RepID=UPI0031CD230F